MVNYLINKGFNLNIQDFSGNTCLHIAAKTGNFDIIKLLIEYKSNINIFNNYIYI